MFSKPPIQSSLYNDSEVNDCHYEDDHGLRSGKICYCRAQNDDGDGDDGDDNDDDDDDYDDDGRVYAVRGEAVGCIHIFHSVTAYIIIIIIIIIVIS